MNMSSQIHVLAVLPAENAPCNCWVGSSLGNIGSWYPISFRSVPVQTQMYQVRYPTFYRVSEKFFPLFFFRKCADKKGVCFVQEMEISQTQNTSGDIDDVSDTPVGVTSTTQCSSEYCTVTYTSYWCTGTFRSPCISWRPIAILPRCAYTCLTQHHLSSQIMKWYCRRESITIPWQVIIIDDLRKIVLKGPWASLHEAEAFGTLEFKGSKLRSFRHDEIAPRITGISTWKLLAVGGEKGRGKVWAIQSN